MTQTKKPVFTIGVTSCLYCFFNNVDQDAEGPRCEIGERTLGGTTLYNGERKPRHFEASEIPKGYPLPHTSPAWCPLREMDVTLTFQGKPIAATGTKEQ